MKLNKLTSAVSVSLLAVALTACGGSDNGDEGPILTPTPAPSTTPAPTPSTTPTPTPAAGSTAAELTAALTAAGLTNANAAALIAANPTLTVGSAEYNTLLAQKLSEQNKNTGSTTDPVSVTVEKQNPHIKGVGDTNNTATVTANQYTRQPGSTYERSANPTQMGGLGQVGTDDPTKQNPYLSNYVLGVEVVGSKVVAIDSTGEYVERDGTLDSGRVVSSTASPYATNNGLRYTAAMSEGNRTFNYAAAGTGTANDAGANDFYNLRSANILNAGTATITAAGTTDVVTTTNQANNRPTIYTIQELNRANVVVDTTNDIQVAMAELTNTNPGRITPATATAAASRAGAIAIGQGLTSGLVVYNAGSARVGNADGAKLGYKIPTYGVEENIYNEDGVVLNAVDTYQPATTVNNANATATGNFLSTEVVQYMADNFGQLNGSDPAGREVFFAEKFRAINDTTSGIRSLTSDAVSNVAPINAAVTGAHANHLSKNVANNHETRVFGKNYNSYETGLTGTQTTNNTYYARYNSQGGMTAAGITPRALNFVQYGRLTNNIDVLADKDANSSKSIVYRQFQQHGADNSVDTYFYRGTHHTTLAQMKDLIAKGGTYQYYGHALTYGVGPKVEETAASTLPNSYGLGSSEATIGNFVQAKYDVAKAKVDGTVYNFINRNLNANTTALKNFTRQDLIKFTGDVYGNTVIGTASKEGTKETGTLTASFYGPTANEIGGSISSIARSAGYDAPKWGAVFGATKGSVVENFNVIEQGNGN